MSTDTKLDTETTGPIPAAYDNGLQPSPPILQVGRVGEKPRIETVNHPAHYGGDTTYETRKVIRAWDLGFNLGNVAKYVSRAGRKPGTSYIEDLEKALFYLKDEIESARSEQ